MNHVVVVFAEDLFAFVARIPVELGDRSKHIGNCRAAAFPVADKK